MRYRGIFFRYGHVVTHWMGRYYILWRSDLAALDPLGSNWWRSAELNGNSGISGFWSRNSGGKAEYGHFYAIRPEK